MISANKIYNYISNFNLEILNKLFEVSAISYYRKSPNGSGVFNYTRPLFVKQNGNIGINYNPIIYQINASKNIEDCLRLINYYSYNPINQTIFKLKPHEILIVDYQQFLHGRTCFPEKSKRKMQRFWFQGLK